MNAVFAVDYTFVSIFLFLSIFYRCDAAAGGAFGHPWQEPFQVYEGGDEFSQRCAIAKYRKNLRNFVEQNCLKNYIHIVARIRPKFCEMTSNSDIFCKKDCEISPEFRKINAKFNTRKFGEMPSFRKISYPPFLLL
jgi:hypothetical protein